MKRILALTLAILMLLSVSACDAQPSQTEPPTTATPETTEPVVEITQESTQAGPAPLSRAAGSYKERFSLGLTEESWMEYYLHIPENATEGMPLIIFLHGDGEIGLIDNLENYGMIESAREIYGEAFPFISLSPCTRTDSWIRDDISSVLKELIDTVVTDYAIDQSRIIITGHSRGAIGTWDLISRYGNYFSAAVPVSCNNENPLDLNNAAKVPVWAFVGDQGRVEKLYAEHMGYAVESLVSAGGDAKLTQLEDHTHIDTDTGAYTREVFDWMLSFCAEEIPATGETAPEETEATVPPVEESVTMPVLYGDPLNIEAGTYKQTHSSAFYGASIDYCMFVPEQAQENMPLIVYLHGDGEVGNLDAVADIEIVKKAKEIYGEAYPFLIVAPNASQKTWIKTWTYNMVYDLIETVAETYKVDPAHIILTGHSRGAIGTWYYINMNYYYPSFQSDISFSCAVPVSHYSAYPINPDLSAQLPIWAICGDADQVEKECIEKQTADIELIRNAGGNALLTVLEGNTHGETEANAYTKKVFEWMLAQ